MGVVDFLVGEDDVDSINDDNFTYDNGDEVTVDPNALFDHNNKNNHDKNNDNNIPLIIVPFEDGDGHLCLPKGISTTTTRTTLPSPKKPLSPHQHHHHHQQQ